MIVSQIESDFLRYLLNRQTVRSAPLTVEKHQRPSVALRQRTKKVMGVGAHARVTLGMREDVE